MTMPEQDGTEAVKVLFSNNASTYGRHFGKDVSGNSYRFAKRAEICRELTEGATGSLLDLACGTGEVTRSVLEGAHFSNAHVSDISKEMISVCKSNMEGLKTQISYNVGNCFDLGGDQKYDMILCIGLIAHTGRIDEIFQLAANSLNAGGRILIQSTLSDSIGGYLTRVLTDRRYQRNHHYSLSHYNHREITSSAFAAGFSLINSRRYSAGLVFLDRLTPRLNYLIEYGFDTLKVLPGSERIYLFEKSSLSNKSD